MARRPRLDEAGAVHHVMNRGVDRQPVFFADADRVEFGCRLGSIHEQFGIETLAYCLMDNHYHLLVRTPEGGLSEGMRHLGLVYTRHTNDRVGRDGPLFRGRFHSIRVTTDRYLRWAARYIHRNPLDVAGVTSPSDYRWSSYRTYLGARRCPEFLRTDLLLGLFGDDPATLAAFTDDAAMRLAPVGTLEDLMLTTEFCIADDDLRHGSESQASHWLRRTLLTLALDRIVDPQLSHALERYLAFPSADARRMALVRARSRADDPTISRIAEAAFALTGT